MFKRAADKKKSVTMYNLIFPVWLLLSPLMLAIFTPPTPWILVILVIMLGNLLVDWAVVAVSLRCQGISDIKRRSLAVLLPVWLGGFLADIIGTLGMAAVLFVGSDNDWFYHNIHAPLAYISPFESPWALLWGVSCLLISAVCIYLFNSRFCLRKADLTDVERKRTALALAVITAPYTFLLPTSWLY